MNISTKNFEGHLWNAEPNIDQTGTPWNLLQISKWDGEKQIGDEKHVYLSSNAARQFSGEDETLLDMLFSQPNGAKIESLIRPAIWKIELAH